MPKGQWFCIQANYRSEQYARSELDQRGFGCLLPLVMVERRHGRTAKVTEAPMFPGFLFVYLDLAAPGWRNAAHTPGVKRILGPHPERPTPIPERDIRWFLERGYDRPIVEDPRVLLPPIEKDASVRILDGIWADHRGVCLWSDGRRAELALTLFGRTTKVTVDRAKVEAL